MIHLIHRYRLPAFHVFLGFCFHLVGKEAHAGEIAGRLRLATRPDLTGSAPVANRRESSKSQLSWRARKRSWLYRLCDFALDELGGKRWQSTDVAFGKTVVDS
jgi:hypothetical protein